MFYFIRTVLFYVVVLTAVTVGVQKFFEHSQMSENEVGENTQKMAGYAMPPLWTQPRETGTGLLLAGMAAQNRRDWGNAWQSFSKISEKYDTNPEIALRALTLALGNGEFDEAVKIATKVNQDYLSVVENKDDIPESYDLVHLLLTLQSLKNNDTDAVEAGINRLKDRSISQFSKPIIQAWMLPDTIKPKHDKGNAIRSYYIALAAEYHGKDKIARKLMEKIEDFAATPEQILMLAGFYHRLDDNEKAISLLEKGLKIQPQNAMMARALTSLKKTPDQYKSEAITSDYHLKGREGAIAMAFHDFSRLLLVDRAIDSALLFAQMGAYLDPNAPMIQATIGDVQKYQKQNDLALKAYKKVAENDPSFKKSLTSKISIMIDMGKFDDAENTLKQLLEKNPNDAYYHYLLGDVYKADKKYQKSIEQYDAAEVLGLHDGELSSDLWPLYYSRAIAFDMLDRWEEAEKDLLMALEKIPNNPIILNYLGYAYADRGVELDKAKNMLLKAVMAAPNDGYIIDSMGWILYRMGDYKGALGYLERAAKIRPYHMVINDHLGDVYWKIGRKVEAKYMWQRAVDYYDETDEEQKRMIAETHRKLKEGMD